MLWINCPSCWKYTSPGGCRWIINSNLSKKEWEKSIDWDTGLLMVSLKGRLPTPCTFCAVAGVFRAVEVLKVEGGSSEGTWPPNDFLSLHHNQERLTCPNLPQPLPLVSSHPPSIAIQTLGAISQRVQKCVESKRGSHARTEADGRSEQQHSHKF